MSNITTIIHDAINIKASYEEKIEEARKALKGKSPEAIREILLPIVAANPKYQVPVVDGQGKAKGTKVLDKTAPKYETCRSMLSDLVADIVGKTANKGDKYEIPEDMLAAAAKLVKLAQGYDEKVMRSLAAQALAAAWLAAK